MRFDGDEVRDPGTCIVSESGGGCAATLCPIPRKAIVMGKTKYIKQEYIQVQY